MNIGKTGLDGSTLLICSICSGTNGKHLLSCPNNNAQLKDSIRPVRPISDAIDSILEARGKEYGKFTEHARITQKFKDMMSRTPKWAGLNDDQKESLEMIAHKIGRILNGNPNNQDSWADIAGYAKLVSDRLGGIER